MRSDPEGGCVWDSDEGLPEDIGTEDENGDDDGEESDE